MLPNIFQRLFVLTTALYQHELSLQLPTANIQDPKNTYMNSCNFFIFYTLNFNQEII